MFKKIIGGFILGTVCAATLPAQRMEIARHQNCNLFDLAEPVKFDASLNGFPAGEGKVYLTISDYFGESKTLSVPVTIVDGKPVVVPLTLGTLDAGYYELNAKATVSGREVSPPMMSFGVVRFAPKRTAAEFRHAGLRYGLKIFQIGSPGVWWRKGTVWNLAEVVDTCALLGLQWTRHQFNQPPDDQPGKISTLDLLTKHPMNAVLKIEGFPEEVFDVERYGTIEEWTKNRKGKKGYWARNTVPKKALYQKWLQEEIAKLPPEQNIFEVGNEVWNYMSAGEFAEWCNMTVEAIKRVRPDARIGADPGIAEYMKKFLAAGGMNGMELWMTHPYSFTPLPEHRTRASLRNYLDMLKRRTGRDFEIWVTEYGWSTAPQSERKGVVSAKIQAQRTARQSLMLYAEDVKALIPHWMGDREQDPKDWDHWFGFFKLNQQPLPVAIAHANSARVIDGSKFAGDLWYGHGIGAMLFECGGTLTLALWTAEEDKTLTLDVAAPEVTVVDIMGREKKLSANGGKVTVKLSGDVIYLRGVGAQLARQATPPGSNLNPDRWSVRENSFAVNRSPSAPKIDGKLDEWAGTPSIELKEAQEGNGAGGAKVRMKWDNEFIYVAWELSGKAGAEQKCFQFGLSARPDRQSDYLSQILLYDYYFKATKESGQEPFLKIEGADYDQPVIVGANGEQTGVRWAWQASDNGGWNGEMAIPVKLLQGLPPIAELPRLAGSFTVSDLADKNRLLLIYGSERPREWAYIVLQ
ncbi:MAG: hypothetical protein LBK60_02300 [Verrucomicrobiales bacterium]|jgi:hypothetical protein|nr:hypothetical protein [Verrucomicrobiales bacterium]